MTATDLLDTLRAQGCQLIPEGDTLCIQDPARALTDDLRDAIRHHKSDLLALLAPTDSVLSYIARCPRCSGTNWGHSGRYTDDGAEVWCCQTCSPRPPDPALLADNALDDLEYELLNRIFVARGKGPTVGEISELLDQPYRVIAAIFEPLEDRGLVREERSGALHLTDHGARTLREWRGEPMENESKRPRATHDPRQQHRLGETPPAEACTECGGRAWREGVYSWACKDCEHVLEKDD